MARPSIHISDQYHVALILQEGKNDDFRRLGNAVSKRRPSHIHDDNNFPYDIEQSAA